MSLATQVASLPHPPSAMKFNGVYLEDKISGYYTESVEGRYNSSIEITDRSITGIDGSEFVRKRYETRSLDVKYSIYADTKIELHTKESQVKQYTREAEAKIIFDDEPQYYWIGTVSEIKSEGIDATGSGIFVSTGTITIALDDPFKYSVVTKEFTASKNSDGVLELTVTNNGTVPVPIDYTITHGNTEGSDNGYIGIVSAEGVIQLGKIQETSDGYSYETGQMTKILSFDDILSFVRNRKPILQEFDHVNVIESTMSDIDPDRALRVDSNRIKNTGYYLTKNSSNKNWILMDSDETKWILPAGTQMTDAKKQGLISRMQELTKVYQENNDRFGTGWTKLGSNDGYSRIDMAYICGTQDHINWLWPYEVEDQSMTYRKLPYYDGKQKECLVPVFTNVVKDGKWHGDVITIPVAEGPTGNPVGYFYAWFNHWFETGMMGQTGEQSIAFLTKDNRIIGAVDIYKTDYTGNSAVVRMWADNEVVCSYDFTPSNKYFGVNPYAEDSGHDDFYKFSSQIANSPDGVRHFFFGSYPEHPIADGLKLAKIQIAFSVWGGNEPAQYKPITINALRDLVVYKCQTNWIETPNHYPPGTIITINGDDTKVYVNGLPKQSEEAVGSKYFLAPPGETKIQFTVSSFCTDPPTCKAKIREKYL